MIGYTIRMTSPQNMSSQQLTALARAYLTADYRWTKDGDWHDMRIGLPAPGLEMCFPHCRTFGMVSAWNPWSVVRDETTNRLADRTLQEALTAHGTPFCAAFASAPNRSWREPSWVVMDMADADFVALQRQHAQLGTLWWTRGAPVRLRMDTARPDGLDADADIDWLT